MISKKNIFKITAASIPAIFIVLSLIMTNYLQTSYRKTEADLIKKETEFVSFELAENLKRDIFDRVRILEMLAQARPDIFPANQRYFEKIVTVVDRNIPGFFAINWVNPDGVIQWVYPQEPNAAALNKNLLLRPELAPYLIQARDLKKPSISHVVNLYQGPKGLIIYVPIYDGKVFKGWYNGVISVNRLLDDFFEPRKLHNIAVSVKWAGHDDYIYRHGADFSGKAEIEFESNILNQKLIVAVDLKRGSVLDARQDRLSAAFTLIYISIALIAAFAFYIIRSQFTVLSLNHALSRDKTLLNILTHDLVTPLTLVTENIKRLKEKFKNEDYPEVDRIIRASEKQKDLLLRVRSFHAANLGKIRLDLVPVSAREIVDEGIALFEEKIKEKNIKLSIDVPENIYCLTDRITAANNVMGNVISNSIKFSENNSTIRISAYRSKNHAIIAVQDQGVGISEDTLDRIFEEDEITSTKGTHGEAGTGLGMLQIKTFMNLYGGSIKITTSEKGTTVLLCFRLTNV